MKKQKILYVVTEDSFFCIHRMALARAARDAGYEVHVAVRISTKQAEIEKEGFTLHSLKWMRRSDIGLISQFCSLLELVFLYRKIHPGIVHHVALKPIVLGTLATFFSSRPSVLNMVTGLGYVFTSSEMKARLLRPFIKAAFKLIDGPGRLLTVENTDDKDFFIKSGLVEPDRVVHVPSSGVNTERFLPAPQPAGRCVVLLAARMLWDKGVGDAVDAARILSKKKIPFHLVLVGIPDPENPRSISQKDLERWAKEENIEWWGYQSDMPAVWRQSHIVLLPTKYREGVPVSLLEGGATERPLVATNSPGCRDLIRDGENGFLVPIGDAASLADILEKLIVNASLREKMGRAARKIICENFSEKIVNDTILKLYAYLLK